MIKEHMEERVRHFEGSLLELVELARCARAGLGGYLALLRPAQSFNSLSSFEGKPPGIQQEPPLIVHDSLVKYVRCFEASMNIHRISMQCN